MAILQNSFMNLPFQDILELYTNQIVPRLTKRNKLITISTAIGLSIVYFVNDMILKPPRNLRHIPHLSFFGFIKSLISRESCWDRVYRLHIPEINKEGHRGQLLEIGVFGWELHLSNPEDIKRVFMKQDLFPKANLGDMVKGTLFGKFVIGPNVILLNGPHWKSQRKIANPAFHRSAPVKMFGNLAIDLFKVMETMGDVVNFSDLMTRWTLDALGKAVFGFEFNATKDRNNEWVNRYNSINDGVNDPRYFFFPNLDSKYVHLFPKRYQIHKELDIFLKMIDELIQKKRAMIKNGVKNKDLDENERDLLDLLIESGEEGNGSLSDEELKSNVCAFFVAGHDTTTSALSFAIHYLAQNQDIQQKAREEAIDILGNEPIDVIPTLEDIKRMPYIYQIIKETLRINPPAAKPVGRVATEDTELSGTFIPKGTTLYPNIYDLHRNGKVWENADVFDPERFSENGEASRMGGNGLGWTPFGNGARICIGMNFSLTEQKVLISMLLRKFTWTTPKNSIHKDKVVTNGINILSPYNLDIQFRRIY